MDDKIYLYRDGLLTYVEIPFYHLDTLNMVDRVTGRSAMSKGGHVYMFPGTPDYVLYMQERMVNGYGIPERIDGGERRLIEKPYRASFAREWLNWVEDLEALCSETGELF